LNKDEEKALIGALIRMVHHEKQKHCYIPQHTQYSRGSRSPLKCPKRGGEHGETPAYDPATAPVSPYLCHIYIIYRMLHFMYGTWCPY